MNLNGVEYYYIRDAQGDITGLFDKTGAQVLSYTYDSWGKLISTSGTLASIVGVRKHIFIEGIGMIPRLDCTIYRVDIIILSGVAL
jgi:YD repeat-containing protein